MPEPEGEPGETVEVLVTVQARGQTFTDTFPLPCGEDYGERLTVRLAGAVLEPRAREEITVERDADGNLVSARKELY